MAEYSEAYRNGWLACYEGIEIDANPYNVETQSYSHGEWNFGWGAMADAGANEAYTGDLKKEYNSIRWGG